MMWTRTSGKNRINSYLIRLYNNVSSRSEETDISFFSENLTVHYFSLFWFFIIILIRQLLLVSAFSLRGVIKFKNGLLNYFFYLFCNKMSRLLYIFKNTFYLGSFRTWGKDNINYGISMFSKYLCDQYLIFLCLKKIISIYIISLLLIFTSINRNR